MKKILMVVITLLVFNLNSFAGMTACEQICKTAIEKTGSMVVMKVENNTF